MELLAVVLTLILVGTVAGLVRALRADGYGSRTPPSSHRSWDDGGPFSRPLA